MNKMSDYEHINDDLTHQIFVELGQNFITPFDREDIAALANKLDDIADYMYASAKYIFLYRCSTPRTDQDFGIIISLYRFTEYRSLMHAIKSQTVRCVVSPCLINSKNSSGNLSE